MHHAIVAATLCCDERHATRSGPRRPAARGRQNGDAAGAGATGLPDAWIAAGAVRNAVWDALHGPDHSTPLTDVDVIWFDAMNASEAQDRRLQSRLCAALPGVTWSVKNQARMHRRNEDPPYADSLDAMRHWPETATGIAARLASDNSIQLCAAYGFADLLDCVLKPTPWFSGKRRAVFQQRVVSKRWQTIWPRLTVAATDQAAVSCGSVGAVAWSDDGSRIM